MPTFSSALLPNTNGLTLGSSSLRWAPFLTNPDITGTLTYSGALSGITTISASGSITSAAQLISTIATGTSPLAVTSITVVTNLNADLLDGKDWTAPSAIGSVTPAAANFTTIGASGQVTSTVSTGTAPLVIASTTQVSNLNVSQLVGGTWAIPNAIGSTTPNTGAFSSVVVGTGSTVTKIHKISASITPAITNANTTSTQTFTYTGATTSDSVCSVDYPAGALGAGLCLGGARISALNTLELTLQNTTAGGITAAAGTYTITLIRV